jgi:hypothetical protein
MNFILYIKAVVFWVMPYGYKTIEPRWLQTFWMKLLPSYFALSMQIAVTLRILVTEFHDIVIQTTTVLIFTD